MKTNSPRRVPRGYWSVSRCFVFAVIICAQYLHYEAAYGQSHPMYATSGLAQMEVKAIQTAWLEKFRKHEFENHDAAMEFVLIPPGKFLMGSKGEPEDIVRELFGGRNEFLNRVQYEFPQHQVTISKPFLMGTFEVTIKQFREFVDATSYATTSESTDRGSAVGWVPGLRDFRRGKEFNWRNVGLPTSDDFPVVNVSWTDAVKYCEWRSKKEGKKYRLPTEAEWEYACRAGTTTFFSFGDNMSTQPSSANTFDQSGQKILNEKSRQDLFADDWDDGYAWVSKVGSFSENNFGLYDMHGNVHEWCNDFFDPAYYSSSRNVDPKGPAEGVEHVIRGGSCAFAARVCRSARRGHYDFFMCDYDLGFRIVCELNENAGTTGETDRGNRDGSNS